MTRTPKPTPGHSPWPWMAEVERTTKERDDAINKRVEMQMRCLNVRDALNKYHKEKTANACDELDCIANGCNTPDLLYNFSDYVHRRDKQELKKALSVFMTDNEIRIAIGKNDL